MTRAERRTLLIAAVIALASVIVLGVIAAAWAALPHQVDLTVDGRTVQVPSGSSVGDVMRLGYMRSARGDILSVSGGVARAGRGGEPTIVRNGRITALAQPVYDGDVLLSVRGADVRERTVTATGEIPPATRYIGKGPLMSVAKPGTAGVVRIVKGQYSGSVVTSSVVVAPRESVVVRREPRPNEKLIALTFDDGPWPDSTLKILKILKTEKVPATFFMVGTSATKRPQVARAVAAAGMTVGSHSFSHQWKSKMSKPFVRKEVYVGTHRVEQITKTHVKWFRSPYGLKNPLVLREVRAEKLRLVGWTVDSRDWTTPGVKAIVRNIVTTTHPGSIILMHDGGGDRSQTVRALPYVIHQLERKGYTFVTLDELAATSR